MTAHTPEDIGIILLAAGQSRRYAGDKRLARLPDGRTLLQASIAAVPATVTQRLLILRPGDEHLAAQFSEQWETLIVENAQDGMGESLAAAARHLQQHRPGWQGALIALGDMPAVAEASFTAIQQALCEQPIVVPHYQGQRGHPVGFQRRFFCELGQLSGDSGARQLLQRHANDCYPLHCDDAGILYDIDTRDAMRKVNQHNLNSPDKKSPAGSRA